ncbi:MAG: valine--tRNA ligase, partial [Dermabacter sp.]|nr:valine--tRNA ligase [Dermabacter sp.]
APLAKAAAGQDESLLRVVSEAIISVRKVKSDAKVSQKTPMLRANLALPEAALSQFESARFDVCALGSIEELTLEPSTDGAITLSKVELGEPPAKKK